MSSSLPNRALKAVQHILAKLGLGVMRANALNQLMSEHRELSDAEATARHAARDLKFLLAMPPEHGVELLKHFPQSRSEFRQDLFVLSELGFKRNGYFVEFGATDGLAGSNSYLLETQFAWRGILAEPAKAWHAQLHNNRQTPIDTRCVWSETGKRITFNETHLTGLSTIDAYTHSDSLGPARSKGQKYMVETVSLLDLLAQHAAPSDIDYLSIDTEGSELEILRAFDFERYRIHCITVEHNHSSTRAALFEFLTTKGYARKHEDISMVDDWYIRTR